LDIAGTYTAEVNKRLWTGLLEEGMGLAVFKNAIRFFRNRAS
jgi:hypothetical protein